MSDAKENYQRMAQAIHDYGDEAMIGATSIHIQASQPGETIESLTGRVDEARRFIAENFDPPACATQTEAIVFLLTVHLGAGAIHANIYAGRDQPQVALKFFTDDGVPVNPDEQLGNPRVALGRILAAVTAIDIDDAQMIYRAYAAAYPHKLSALIAHLAFAGHGRAARGHSDTWDLPDLS